MRKYNITNSQTHAINEMSAEIHEANVAAGWWEDLDRVCNRLGHDKDARLVEMWFRATKIALIHSEVSEMLESLRKGTMDSHLKHRSGVEVEGADTFIRLADLLWDMRLMWGDAVQEKFDYNQHRPDHKREARDAPGGKKA